MAVNSPTLFVISVAPRNRGEVLSRETGPKQCMICGQLESAASVGTTKAHVAILVLRCVGYEPSVYIDTEDDEE